jgi:hypothetical protein
MRYVFSSCVEKNSPDIIAVPDSIHKSQGQTLPRVKVNLRKVFEKGTPVSILLAHAAVGLISILCR